MNHLQDRVARAMQTLRDAAPDGRVTYPTAHRAGNTDGSWTVAVRNKIGCLSVCFRVDTEAEARECCAIIRKQRRNGQ